MQAQLSVENAKTFMKGGKAVFTLQSKRTGQHFTYRASKPKGKTDDDVIFVAVLTGSDNETAYTYAGLLKEDRVQTTGGSKIKADAPSITALNWALRHLHKGQLHPDLAIFHEGRCCRCGRKLTTPESIQNGIGPECSKKDLFS